MSKHHSHNYNSTHTPPYTQCKSKSCSVNMSMLQLWDIHVSLTREVVLADALKTPNLNSSLVALLQNQKDLGANLALYYGQQAGHTYTALLTKHIDIAVNIVNLAIAKQPVAGAVDLWHKNGKEISHFLATTIPTLDEAKMQALFDAHLECTLNEAVFIINGNYPNSQTEYQTCLKRVKTMSSYIANGIVVNKFR